MWSTPSRGRVAPSTASVAKRQRLFRASQTGVFQHHRSAHNQCYETCHAPFAIRLLRASHANVGLVCLFPSESMPITCMHAMAAGHACGARIYSTHGNNQSAGFNFLYALYIDLQVFQFSAVMPLITTAVGSIRSCFEDPGILTVCNLCASCMHIVDCSVVCAEQPAQAEGHFLYTWT
jgi:hypothetical protein